MSYGAGVGTRLPAGVVLTDQASIQAHQPDPNAANSTAQVSTVVSSASVAPSTPPPAIGLLSLLATALG